MNDAPFQSADHALRSSFNLAARQIIKNASITAVMTGGSPPPGTMSAQEKHAQAALVIGYCHRLPEVSRYYVWARYAGGDERQDAFDGLTLYVLVGFALGRSSFEGYRTMVEQYFSSWTAIRPIRKALGVRWEDALAKRRQAFQRLDVVHDQAISTVTRHMETQGLIKQGESYAHA